MLSNPPSTGNVDLDNFLRSVKRHIDDALRPADGWRLSDFSADVSEVISDKRDLIDIVTRYDDINALKDSVDLILADYAEAIADHKAIGEQYQDHAEVFTHTMEWWNQNRKIIEDAAEVMAATLQASESAAAAEASALRAGNHKDGASQARDAAVTAKNQAATSATNASTHAGKAQTSAQNAAQSATKAANSEQAAKNASASASGSASAAAAAAESAEADRVVVEQAATSASWSGDRLTVLGATSPSLKGPKGDKGAQGPKGDKGDTGAQGLRGLQGAQGPKGDQGDTGPRGLKGDKGDKGDKGAQGPQGDQGPAGPGSGDVLWSELTPALAGKAPVSHTHTAANISDATTVGRNVLKATDAAAARSAIGAGTSNLALGTTSSTAARGNHTHTASDVGAAPASHTHTSADISDAYHYVGDDATAHRVVKTYSNGHIYVRTDPPAPDAVPRRKYVDDKVAGHTLTNSQLPVPEIIPRKADLNNYLNTGLYLQNMDADARSGLNYPPNATNAGMLEVIAGSTFTYQRYTEYTAGRVFSRVRYGTSWRSWIDLLDASEATNVLGSGSYGKIVRREPDNENIRTGDPTQTYHAANKTYVDAEVAKKADTSHTHTAAQISDATTVGRNVLKASSQAAARSAIGAGTSNLAIGTTSTTAKAGNYQPTAANISDATTVGRNVLKATDAAAARSAIGAGTSNLALGTTSSTAARGNHTHTKANITDLETISTGATANHVVKRITSGNITVPTTPNANTSATSKSYVDGRTPEVRVVSALPASPAAGVVYMVTG